MVALRENLHDNFIIAIAIIDNQMERTQMNNTHRKSNITRSWSLLNCLWTIALFVLLATSQVCFADPTIEKENDGVNYYEYTIATVNDLDSLMSTHGIEIQKLKTKGIQRDDIEHIVLRRKYENTLSNDRSNTQRTYSHTSCVIRLKNDSRTYLLKQNNEWFTDAKIDKTIVKDLFRKSNQHKPLTPPTQPTTPPTQPTTPPTQPTTPPTQPTTPPTQPTTPPTQPDPAPTEQEIAKDKKIVVEAARQASEAIARADAARSRRIDADIAANKARKEAKEAARSAKQAKREWLEARGEQVPKEDSESKDAEGFFSTLFGKKKS